jgi:hypothetical protein
MKYLIEMAGEHQDRLNWPEIRTALKERKGYPIKIARRPAIITKELASNEAQQAEQNIKSADTEIQESAVLDIESVAEKLSIIDKAEKTEPASNVASGTHRAITHSLNN